jgi:nucleotide-binding universal stress UspA family protein
LLDDRMLNSVLALMVVTASLGPWLTGVAMPRLAAAAASQAGLSADSSGQLALVRRSLRVLVPMANPASMPGLITLAGLVSGGEQGANGLLLPLVVVSPRQVQAGGEADAGLLAAIAGARATLGQAAKVPTPCPSRPLLRVDGDVAAGIARSALEQGADLVVMGMGPGAALGRWLFGDLVDATCRQAHCPVVVARLLQPPEALQRLLVPIKDLSAAALEQFQLAERIAASLGGSITLLHLHEPRLAAAELGQLAAQLERWRPKASATAAAVPVQIELRPNLGVEAAIRQGAGDHDLVILRSQRRLVAGLPIAASDRTSRLLSQLDTSVLVISDPLH